MDFGEHQTAIEGMMKKLGLSPFAHVNVGGGHCGITRLVQLRLNGLGVDFIPMEEKIRTEAENAATGRPVKNSSVFSSDKDFMLWGQCLDAMGRACAKTQTKFKVIQFEWVISEENFVMPPCPCCGIAKDLGNLVFVDQSTKRYIVVECDWGKRKPRELRNHVRRLGHVLFCMARYLGYGPEFVRYCVYTKGDKELPDGITDLKCTPQCGGQWGEVNETNFRPALMPRDLSNIDKVLQKDEKVVQRTEKWRKELGLDLRTLKKQVATSSDDDPGEPALWFEELENKDDPEVYADFIEHMCADFHRRHMQFTQGDPPKPEAKKTDREATSSTSRGSTSRQDAAGRPTSSSQGANGRSNSNSKSRPAAGNKPEPCCASCKRTAKDQKLLYCGACRAVKYCSRECQRVDYKSHKLVCKPKGS